MAEAALRQNGSSPSGNAIPRADRTSARALRAEGRRQLRYELISGLSGLALAVFMWGHMLLVGSILAGERAFERLAAGLEDFYIAQPTVLAIAVIFLVHAVTASRKVPAQLRERRKLRDLARSLRAKNAARDRTSVPFRPHIESMLWIWQLRTGLVIFAIGSFHIVLVGIDVFTPIFGERIGIEASSTMSRVAGGLWPLYAVLLLCVEFHASVGLYRLAVKWGVGSRLSRPALRRIERVVLVVFLGLGSVTLAVLAGWLAPPLEPWIGVGS